MPYNQYQSLHELRCSIKPNLFSVKTSWKDLGLLFLLVGMGMLVFGSLEYYIENEEVDTGFISIPQVIL